VDQTGERWHPRGEASSSDTDELSKANEQLLVRPEGGLWVKVRDPLEEAGSLPGS